MKRLINFILISLISFTINSQNNNNLPIYESNIFEDNIKTDSILSVYPIEIDKYLVLRNDKKRIVFDVFNQELEKEYSGLIKLERRESYIESYYSKNELKIFTEKLSNSIKVLKCYIIDLKVKTRKQIDIAMFLVGEEITTSRNKGTFYAESPNSDFFTLTNYSIFRGYIYYQVDVFNSKTLELLYTKKSKREENSFFSILDINIDNDKNVFSLGKSYFNPDNKIAINEKKYSFLVEKLSSSKSEIIKLALDNINISNVKSIMKEKTYDIFGYYSNSENGIFNISIDIKSMKIIDKKLNPLPYKIYEDLNGKDKINKKIGNFTIEQILTDNDNDSYIVAVNKYTASGPGSFDNNGAPTGGAVYEIYGSIIILKLNDKGLLEWGKSIYRADSRPFIKSYLNKNKLHIIINSSNKIKELKDGRSKIDSSVWKSYNIIYEYQYSSDGKESIYTIEEKNKKPYFIPFFGKRINNSYLIIEKYKKENKIIRVQIN